MKGVTDMVCHLFLTFEINRLTILYPTPGALTIFAPTPTIPLSTKTVPFHDVLITSFHLSSLVSSFHTPWHAFSAANSAFNSSWVSFTLSFLLESSGRSVTLPKPLRTTALFRLTVWRQFCINWKMKYKNKM